MFNQLVRSFAGAAAICSAPHLALAQPGAEDLPVPQYPPPQGEPAAGDSPPPPARPGPVRRVHEGFLASLDVGGGARSLTIRGGGTVSIDGNGAALGLRVGGAVLPNLVLHGTLLGAAMEDPEISVGGETVVVDEARVTFSAVGPGLTYYFMPVDVYVGASLLVGRAKVEFEEETLARSEWGAGMELRVGKAFWISDSAFLGLSLQGFGANMSGQNTTETLKARGASLLAEVTFD